MSTDTQMLSERLFEALIAGDRPGSKGVIADARSSGLTAQDLVTELFWPTYEQIERLFREDKLPRLNHQLATRLLRVLQDQTAGELTPLTDRARTVYVACGPSENEELGAQMAVDLLEHHGFGVKFGGGGIACDELMSWVNESRPDVLLLFASAPGDLPEIRRLIDTLHEVGACPSIQVAVGGGVFNRAEGLAEEIGADVWGCDPLEMVDFLTEEPERRATSDQRTVGRSRRKPREAA